MHNKGKRYIHCKECNRKRYCSHKRLPDDYREWTCSKGHVWITEIGTLERIDKIVADTMIPKLKEILENDDTFYSKLKKE